MKDFGQSTYANRSRPSAAATPSKLFKRPDRLRVLVSVRVSFWLLLFVSAAALSFSLADGVPVDFSSLCVDRVNAASRSSSSNIQRAGTRPISVVNVESLIQLAESDTT